ncbi:centrosomal protein of 164 kDa-like [Bombina bombina]|uniref:centrosomal protein of 164 kDa-like n=1 Tax=Bombina bombina TaxID=8345 RepID=UPI00235B1EFD|nr:centrosomal protein of 164 kDa-like [Bombina bombina]
MMAASALRIGDQLILEEDYDENYIPQEHEIQEYARLIGIDPEAEPELMWLARECIVAPLPSEWKPCQDVTGDIYYFNFSTGKSTWDHPNDEHYREMVKQEREKLQARGGGKKKEKIRKKEKKKEKKSKEVPKPIPSSLGPMQSSLGSLAPLRGLSQPTGTSGGTRVSLSSSAGSSGGFDSLLTGTPRNSSKLTSYIKSSAGHRSEEINLPGLEEDMEGEQESEDQSPWGSPRLLKNLHMDLGYLGGGFEYEDSEVSEDAKHLADNKEAILDLKSIGQSDEKVLDISALSPRPLSPKEAKVLEDVKEFSESAKRRGNVLEFGQLDEKVLDISALSPLPLSPKALEVSEDEDFSESANSRKAVLDFGFRGQSVEKVLDISALSSKPLSPKDIIEEEDLSEDIEEKDISEEDVSKKLDMDQMTDIKEKVVEKVSKENARNHVSEEHMEEQIKDNLNEAHIKDHAKAITERSERQSHLDEESVSLSEESSSHKIDPPETVVDFPNLVENYSKPTEATQKFDKETSKLEDAGKERALEEEIMQRPQHLRESLRLQEEKDSRLLREQHESNLRTLRETLELEMQKEEARMREIQTERLQMLESELRIERETEEKRIREREESLHEDLHRAAEQLKTSLEELGLQLNTSLKEKIKSETEASLKEERNILLKERETLISELRETLKLQTKEISQNDVQTANDVELTHRKVSQVLEYERELSDLLEEKRREVQRDHETKMARLKEQHDQEQERVQSQYEEQEHNLRTQMLEMLQEERRRMLQIHEQELEAERQILETNQEERRCAYQDKETQLQALEQKQQIRRKHLEAQTLQIDIQEDVLKKRREQLDEQELELEKRAEGLETSRLSRHVQDNKEQLLRKSVRQIEREFEEIKGQKSELETEIQFLQSRRERLQKIVSDLDKEISCKRKHLNDKDSETEKMEPVLTLEDLTRTRKSFSLMESSVSVSETSLEANSSEHFTTNVKCVYSNLDDVLPPTQLCNPCLNVIMHSNQTNALLLKSGVIAASQTLAELRLPVFICIKIAVESRFSSRIITALSGSVRHYISSQGASIQSAKDFLQQQTHSMRRRQSLLRSTKHQWRHDNMQLSPDADGLQLAERGGNSIEEVPVRSLDEAMRHGRLCLLHSSDPARVLFSPSGERLETAEPSASEDSVSREARSLESSVPTQAVVPNSSLEGGFFPPEVAARLRMAILVALAHLQLLEGQRRAYPCPLYLASLSSGGVVPFEASGGQPAGSAPSDAPPEMSFAFRVSLTHLSVLLRQEPHILHDVHSTMQKGQILLQNKEQHLQDLENSLMKEILEEDGMKGASSKKVVTFDLSDSEDSSSILSTDLNRCSNMGSKPFLPIKVQHLSNSLCRITAELNGVLKSMESVTSDPNVTLPTYIPTSTPLSVPQPFSLNKLSTLAATPLSSPSSRTNGIISRLNDTSSSSLDAMLKEKLRKYFPEHNYFVYQELFFLQVKGTAMGTKFAPSFAKLFMGWFEEQYIYSSDFGANLVFYGRYIDNLIFI